MKNKNLFFIACMIVCSNNQAGQDWSLNSPRQILALCYIALLASTIHNNSGIINQSNDTSFVKDEYPTTLQTRFLMEREEKNKQNKNHQNNYNHRQKYTHIKQPSGKQHRQSSKYDCPEQDQKICHKNGLRKK
ncbi:MAG: hypothetical protein ACXWL5_01920 [Candidatus Chromulinivorax sp.]